MLVIIYAWRGCARTKKTIKKNKNKKTKQKNKTKQNSKKHADSARCERALAIHHLEHTTGPEAPMWVRFAVVCAPLFCLRVVLEPGA